MFSNPIITIFLPRCETLYQSMIRLQTNLIISEQVTNDNFIIGLSTS